MGAAVDCEAIGAGLLGQPVNTLTTAAFLIAGIWVMVRRRSRRWVGMALASTGVGSFLFHGPMTTGSQWAHDVTLAWLILVVLGSGRSWERWTRLPGLTLVAVLFAVLPAAADPVAVGLTALAVISLLAADHSTATWGPLLLLGVAGVIGRLGATGGPLCDPASPWQPHGLWHLAAAAAVTWWATAAPVKGSEPT